MLMVITCGFPAGLAVALEPADEGGATEQATGTQASPDTPAANPTPTPVVLEITGVRAYTDDPRSAGMGDSISLAIKGLYEAHKRNEVKPEKLILYLAGRPLDGVHPVSLGKDEVVFRLERTPTSRDGWNALLGSPDQTLRTVTVSAGFKDDQSIKFADEKSPPTINLILFRKQWALVSLIGLIVAIIVCWKLARNSNLLRDSGPPKVPAGESKPYSLAKVQVAWWFFLVVGCFLLIYLITGEFTMTEQALVLIGIGTGTALGSAMIDASKRGSADSDLETLQPQRARLAAEISELDKEIVALAQSIKDNQGGTDAANALLATDREAVRAKTIERAEKQERLVTVNSSIADAEAGLEKPVSEGFWRDLVTDANGVSFHRFQMIVWTVVLGALFLAGVYKDLAMPEFSTTMLALMGISAGTYLGFKVPERQSQALPEAKKTEEATDEKPPGG